MRRGWPTVGATGTITPTATPSKSFEGHVVRKEDFATTRNERMGTETPDGSLKEIKVTLALDGRDDTMRPGGTLRADITTELVGEALLVPIAAVDESGGEPQVVLEGGEVRSVKLGESSLTQVQIVDGLVEGQRVELR